MAGADFPYEKVWVVRVPSEREKKKGGEGGGEQKERRWQREKDNSERNR